MVEGMWEEVFKELERRRANDVLPVCFLGDRVESPVRWIDTVEWGQPHRYEASYSSCPDCGALFMSSSAKLIPEDWSVQRKRGRTHYERRNRKRCNPCKAERTKTLQRAAEARFRAKKATPKQPVACAHCNTPFTPQRSTARFCSTTCRVRSLRRAQR